MEGYYRERFEAQRRLHARIASSMEVNDILETMRDELKTLIPEAMESCILLLDPDAVKYTRPLQCALYDRPVNCIACKRNRAAVRKAISRKKGVVVSASDPVVRQDGTRIPVGPEAAIPVWEDGKILAVVSVVASPGTRFHKKDFLLIRDFSETLKNVIVSARKHWETTQEKIRISRMLAHLSPFVPESVREMVRKNPEKLDEEKQKRDVSVLFLDLEGYTRLSLERPEAEVNEIVEKMFSSFVDPIHRSHGDINETAGDGLMIIFKDHDAAANAVNSVKAALDIYNQNKEMNESLAPGLPPMVVNMGINSGQALVGMTRFKGSLGTRMTYTASGPVTNIAARLAAHATGGDILMGEGTARLIHGLWPVHDRGSVLLKGMDIPLRVFSLLRSDP
ncbi:MAG: GAF domain-containing protein [Deltaproteobacteria bacterium]|nr:GAF domain-containing protein [Deltaproteobacteria bacterium]MBW1924698.1 GAF domain-containing protein [Deltaproteobacteria bacterium]MBW1948873.1 GAF domain-containing protein [Deltaproteobacteria bacterium]MBW2006720.1 GAF domain-containing protein [Deltaproteobacteria bacterium]MBW2348486.1 GAF domain-containing protein [Deltaproteobacteria bacterium]